MSYDPFVRGLHPVGVRTLHLSDDSRGRSLPVEVWYPAVPALAGRDLQRETQDKFELLPGFGSARQQAVRDGQAAALGPLPLVAFSHGFGGHRRQSTFLCTHLASHGYLVAAVDHTGNTILDVFEMAKAAAAGTSSSDTAVLFDGMIRDRPLDISFMIDALLNAEDGDLEVVVDSDRIGICGHSFGGWTSLTTTAADRRIKAVVPLAPAGGANPISSSFFSDSLRLDWGREVPALLLVADRDTILPLAGMHEILAKMGSPKRMLVLCNADHMHFCDRVEKTHEMFRKMPPSGAFAGAFAEVAKKVPPMSELCSGERANEFVRGMTLAHMDAVLCRSAAATRFLGADLVATLDRRGIEIEEVDCGRVVSPDRVGVVGS